jgi:hypothetical protein
MVHELSLKMPSKSCDRSSLFQHTKERPGQALILVRRCAGPDHTQRVPFVEEIHYPAAALA